MARLDILDETARRDFERPPALNAEQRRHFFALTPSLRNQLRGLDTALNQVGFLLGVLLPNGRIYTVSN